MAAAPLSGLAPEPDDSRASARTRWHDRARSPLRLAGRPPILGEGLFRDAVVRERKRADRGGQPFAVLLVDRGGCPIDAYPWAAVVRAIGARRREIDVLGWFERGHVLGLLMPDVAGAARPLDVMHHVQAVLQGRLGGPTLPSTRLYAHAVRAESDGTALPSVDLLVEALAGSPRHGWRDAAKRGLDIAGSLGLLALFSPLMLAIFAAVKWTSPGPALFRQTRVGRRGEPFTMLKFRTMDANAGHGLHQDYATWFIRSSSRQPRHDGEVYKLTNDPRVTRLGHLLRRTSLDELPQFWNVLRGEMSLVGPRPPLPFEVEEYQPWHRRRILEAKPGVTGLWQVSGRSRTTFDEMVRLDLRYARTHTVWMDLRILAATPRAMITGKGAF
jgi:lipopolysaccharide/colanic/teichoic acid biosynthesis glycosyltransferase